MAGTPGETRILVSSRDECPENVILREGESGLYYVPGAKGYDGTVGGPRGDVMDNFERSDEVFKPFGPYDDMDDCISDNQDKDDPGAYCASIHHEATGEWPAEKYEKMTEKVYVASEDEAPDGVELKEDGDQLYYEKQQVYEHVQAVYSEDVEEELEEETDVEMPDPNESGDGTTPEEDFDDRLDDLRDEIHDVEEEEGPQNVA